MNKINFKDLPSTETPLSASNLNQMQTNIENAIELIKNIKKVRFKAKTLSTTSEEKLLLINPLSDSNVSYGDKLTLDTTNSEIVIGSEVSVVEVVYSLWFQSGSAGNKHLIINVNGENKAYLISKFDSTPNFENIEATFALSVNQGDRISFRVRGSVNDVINTDDKSSFAYVKVIA